MQYRSRPIFGLVASAFVWVSGCSPDSGGAPHSSGDAAPDGTLDGSGGSSGSSGSGGTAGNASTGGAAHGGNGTGGATVSAGGTPGVGGGACNDLVLDAPLVTAVPRAGPPPVGVGGVIADGRWNLTAYEYYGQNPSIVPHRASYDVRGRVVQYVLEEEGRPLERNTFTLTVAGTQVTKERSCPDPATQVDEFTASPGEVVFIRTDATSTRVWHLTRP